MMLRSLACCVLLLLAAAPAARAQTHPYLGDRLAYVSGGKLYVGFPRPRLLPGPGAAGHPAFSADGQWLAFLRRSRHRAQLWLARADGSQARRIGTADWEGFQWSPTADVLAVQPLGRRPIRLVPVHSAPHALPNHLSGTFLWSPDGHTLATVAWSPGGRTRLALVRGQHVTSYSPAWLGRDDPIRLAAWWPDGHSLLFWLDPGGCESCIADGTRLIDYNLRTGRERTISTTLTYRDWIAASGKRLLVVTGGGRSAFYGKRLQLCTANAACRDLPGNGPNQISLDPSWAPRTGEMAFVVAPAWKTYGWQSARPYRAWLRAPVLWTAHANGTDARPVPSAVVPHGVQDPEWTRDGRGLLFIRNGGLWLDSHFGAGNPHRIAQLVSAGALPNYHNPAFQGWYYGHMDWHALFAWY